MKKLFVFDIHSTLLNDQYELSEFNQVMIKKLVRDGHKVAMASGHHWTRVKEEGFSRYDIPFIAIANTGAQIFDFSKNEHHVLSEVSREMKSKMLEVAKGYPCVLYFHTADRPYTVAINESFEVLNKLPIPLWEKEMISLEDAEDIIMKNQITQISIKTYAQYINEIYEKVSPSNTDGHRLDKIMDLFVDCGTTTATKWTGAEHVAKANNIQKEDIYVFGDDSNDISMFANATNSICPANAISEIKSLAKVVSSKDNNQSFIADYLLKNIYWDFSSLFNGVYFITNEATDKHGRDNVKQAQEFIEAGAKIIQYRAKNKANEDFLSEAQQIRKLTSENGVFFVVNDNLEVANKVKADALHIGLSNSDLSTVRENLNSEILIGASVSSEDELKIVTNGLVDYIGVGAVYPTATKSDAKIVNKNLLVSIKDTDLPCTAIGGINPDRAKELKAKYNISSWAVISDITKEKDIKNYIKKYKQD